MKFQLCLLFLLGHLPLLAQLSGSVSDPAGEALAFVSVLPNDDPALVVLTDIEGRFVVKKEVEVRSLTFRYVGYETLRIEGDSLRRRPLKVVLRPADYDLPEAVVIAGENPAHILIRRAVAHRDENNPDKRRSYTCLTYNKLVFDPVPQRKVFEALLAQKDTASQKIRNWKNDFEAVEKNLEVRHTFLMESVTERRFMQPDLVQETVVSNRVSGFQSSGMVALANAVQPFSFYGDNLRIVDRDFVNPVSPGSTGLYFFNIEDTLYQAPDTIYVISFKPRKGKVFTALEGVLHLHSYNWAIQNVRARPATQAGNLEMSVEQAYQLVPTADGKVWFPAQLNFELALPQYPEPIVGIRASGKSYVTDVRVEAPVRLRDFNPETPLLLPPGASTRADSAWQRWHELAPLSEREQQTYTWLDSIGDLKKFDTWGRWLDAVSTGRFPLYKNISADLTRLLKLNEFEGARLGFGLTNAHTRPLTPPKTLEWSTYAGFGFRDKTWKYGASALWRISRSRQTQAQVFWRNDLREPGALHELTPPAFVNRNLYASRMDFSREFGAALGSRLWKGASVRLSVQQQDIRPAYNYFYGSETIGFQNRFRFREATAFFRYTHGENNRALLGGNIQANNKWPVLEAAWTRGWGDYSYERIAIALYQSVYIRQLGRTTWRIEAGQVSAGAPLAKLFTLNQIKNNGNNRSIFVVRNTFQVLPDTLFAANRFVNAFIAQEVGPVLYRKKYSAPYLTLLQNIGWDQLEQPELHQGLPLRTAENTLLETGIQLDDLYRFNYVNFAYMGLGFATFYRWGGLSSDKPEENLIWRLSLRLTL